jgi:hypothetical protein
MKQAPLRLLGLVLALQGGAAMAIETPKHDVLKSYPDFEVRQYATYLVAETEVEGEAGEVGSEAFSRLAGYIFGNNREREKLAMTAPVTQTPASGARLAMTAPVTQAAAGPRRWRVQFMMPSGSTLETLPVPNDPRVQLRALSPSRFAAIRFSGTWSQANYQEHLEALRAAMQREGLEARGEPVWARYDPPFKPWFLRTNEILIPVD